MTTEIGLQSNDINFAIAVSPAPLKPLSTNHIKPGPKPGKAAEIREYDQALAHKIIWHEEPILYSCGDSRDCLGYIITCQGYTLVCIHCSEKDNVDE